MVEGVNSNCKCLGIMSSFLGESEMDHSFFKSMF